MDLKDIGGDIPWSLTFGDYLNSCDSERTKELETIARRHGFEQLIASEKNVNQSKTDVLFTNRTNDSNLNRNRHTDFYDEHNHTFCYLCSLNQHEHEHKHTKPRDEYKRRKLIPYINPKAKLSSDRPAHNSSSSSSDFISYRFIVRTGTQKNSGTRAQVFLYMYGTEKNWSSIHLRGRINQNSATSIDGFPTGSIRTFCLKGPDIGQLHHLNVNLVGSRSNKEWFLQEIEVTNLKTSTIWLCEFNCWLPKTDGQESNQIQLNVHRATELSLSIYILQIRTSEKSFGSSNADIHITVRGSTNQTCQLSLTSNQTNLFEQNQLDTFAIVGSNLGDLLEITIESDKGQYVNEWSIKEIAMWKIIPNDDDRQSHVYFPLNTSFGKKVKTLKAKCEIYPITDQHFKGPISYQVTVQTGKVMNAGTDANVFLIIHGKSGRTAIHQLNNRSKNDFERNTLSEFTIMDIDVGEIDRIKIWHDTAHPGAAWFLDSVTIHKKHSTCHIISQIYIQRLEQISNALYRQVQKQMNKNPTVQRPSANEMKRHSIDRQSLKFKDDDDRGLSDRLGSNRGILRSPVMYDRASLQKKVTWDEQSIGSQDDLLSIHSRRTKSMPILAEQKHNKEESYQQQTDQFDYQVYWISSHNYQDNQWRITSVEESNSFDLDPSVRSFLLSDRLSINNERKPSIREHTDEIYEFQAHRWLAKDKEDGKLEVYLTPKTTRSCLMTSNANIDSQKKQLSPSKYRFGIPHHNDDNQNDLKESRRSSSHNLESPKRTPRDLASRNLQLSSSRSSILSKTPLDDLHSSQHNTTERQKEESARINPSTGRLPLSSSLTPRAISSPDINYLTSTLSGEQELTERLTGQSPRHPRSPITSLSALNQRARPPGNTNQHESSVRLSHDLTSHSRSTDAPALSSDQHIKSPGASNYPNSPLTKARDSLSRISNELPNNLRSTPLTNSRNPPDRTSDELSNYSRSSLTSMSSLNQRTKSLESTNEHESPGRSSDGLPSYSRANPTSISSSNQRLKSPRIDNEFTSAVTNEQDLLTKITTERSPRLRSSATSLSPLNQRTNLPRNTSGSINLSINAREPAAHISAKPPAHPRSSTSELSKPTQSNNDSTRLLPRTSIGPLSRPKSAAAVHSNPNLSSQKSISDQIYNSAYGTVPLDDF